jgi:methylenetetrahydrofolate dehydrogenase (NADP+) / methenyltetrahydrofolate cyclohydrolase
MESQPPISAPPDGAATTLKIKGAPLADAVKQEVTQAAAALTAAGVCPKMAVILATDDAASVSYAEAKQRTAAQLGIALEIHNPGSAVTQEQLHDLCRRLSQDDSVHGILLELPLAPHLDGEQALDHLDPAKDIDGMTARNMGLIAVAREDEALASATAQACIRLAETQTSLAGKKVAVIGRGRTVGRPLALMLVNRHATVTVCHSRTPDLAAAVADCDVVFVAIGKARAIGAAQLRAGQIVVDAGINFVDGKLAGDVDAASVEGIVAALTPVPGGVGPLTSAIIFQNLIRAARRQHPG